MTRLSALAFSVALLAPGLALAEEITVVGLDGKSKTLAAEAVAALPRATVQAGKKSYEGPIVSYVLRDVGAPAGARMHGGAVKSYVVVTGKDGFGAVMSLAEADKDFHDGPAILADKVDGAPLPAKEAPFRLVVTGDKIASRSVYGVAKIELRKAD